jgi:hypothetical protein
MTGPSFAAVKSLLAIGLALAAVPGSAMAQYAPGSIGNGGRMPETMSPGALAPPPTPSLPPPGTPASSLGARYPDTESLSRARIESQGYRVDRLSRGNNGAWRAETRRDAVPTRPLGVPSKVTIYPDGRVVEEREPLSRRPAP